MFRKPNYHRGMEWTTIIEYIRRAGFTLAQIAEECGFASRGHVHDVLTGKQGEPKWSIGDKLLKLQRKARRRMARTDRG